MFAQKFSRNKVELRVRCLPRPLCHFPSPLCLCSAERLFQLCSPFLAEFVSARSRRKPLEKWKNSGKKTYYKPFCILFRFLLDPDLDTVSQPNPPPPPKKHHLATPLAATAYCCHAFSFYRYRKRSWKSFRFHNRILINFRKPNYKVLL